MPNHCGHGRGPRPYRALGLFLFYDPDKPPSKTELVIAAVRGRNLEGSFYGSPFEDAGFTSSGEGVTVYMATTRDQSGPYFHSWRAKDARTLDGETYSSGRGF
jgi:hypothetical protein